MNFLAIDTSADYLTVVAKKGEREKILFESDCAMRHSSRLMGAIEETLGEIGLTPSECDFFCAVTGPGSFTGIRIGISAVKGFCSALAKFYAGLPISCLCSAHRRISRIAQVEKTGK